MSFYVARNCCHNMISDCVFQRNAIFVKFTTLAVVKCSETVGVRVEAFIISCLVTTCLSVDGFTLESLNISLKVLQTLFKKERPEILKARSLSGISSSCTFQVAITILWLAKALEKQGYQGPALDFSCFHHLIPVRDNSVNVRHFQATLTKLILESRC